MGEIVLGNRYLKGSRPRCISMLLGETVKLQMLLHWKGNIRKTGNQGCLPERSEGCHQLMLIRKKREKRESQWLKRWWDLPLHVFHLDSSSVGSLKHWARQHDWQAIANIKCIGTMTFLKAWLGHECVLSTYLAFLGHWHCKFLLLVWCIMLSISFISLQFIGERENCWAVSVARSKHIQSVRGWYDDCIWCRHPRRRYNASSFDVALKILMVSRSFVMFIEKFWEAKSLSCSSKNFDKLFLCSFMVLNSVSYFIKNWILWEEWYDWFSMLVPRLILWILFFLSSLNLSFVSFSWTTCPFQFCSQLAYMPYHRLQHKEETLCGIPYLCDRRLFLLLLHICFGSWRDFPWSYEFTRDLLATSSRSLRRFLLSVQRKHILVRSH